MLLCARDSFARYYIECPPECRVEQEDDTDFLIVPNPDDPAEPLWLFDEFLIDAARSGDLGLRMAFAMPLN